MNTISANGSTDVLKTEPGRRYVVWLQGDFKSGSVALESSLDGVTWSQIEDSNGPLAFTASGDGADFVAPTNRVRLTLSGAGASPSVNYELNAQ